MAEAGTPSKPDLGVWLVLLIFGFVLAPLRLTTITYHGLDEVERQSPWLLAMPHWDDYKRLSAVICFAVLVTSATGIYAIAFGTRRKHLELAFTALWFNALGPFVLDFLSAGVLFGFEVACLTELDPRNLMPLIGRTAIAFGWSGYLLFSEQCRQRYRCATQ